MVENPTILASQSENRTSTRARLAQDLEWYFLSAAKWLFLADVAERSATVENGLPLFQAVAQGWYVGTLEPVVA